MLVDHKGWAWHPQSWTPEPGAVVSRYNFDWVPFIERIPTTSAHVGILDYDGAWINAGPSNINRFPHITSGEYQKAHFRTKD